VAVKLRMSRMGRRNRPFFRINAVESRTPRDGVVLEKLGHYDPIEKDAAKQIVLNKERAQYWLDKGAVPSDTVSQILLRQGIKHKYAEESTAHRAKARALARAKGRPFTKAERIATQKQAEAAKEKAKVAEKTKVEHKEEKAKTEVQAKAEPEVVEEKAQDEVAEQKTEPEPEAKEQSPPEEKQQ